MDKEGHTEAALRVFRRNLWEPEDGQEGAKLLDRMEMLRTEIFRCRDALIKI